MLQQQVLAVRDELATLSFDIVNDLFGATWLASHVRLVELLPDDVADLALPLAYALSRNPVEEFPVEEWLPNTEFRPTPPEELAGWVGQAIDDIREEGDRPNDVLVGALERLSTHDVRSLHEIEAHPGPQRPNSPYEYGPTCQMFWVSGDRFYFLEVHHES